MATTTARGETAIRIDPVHRQTIEVSVLGSSPLIPRRLSEKAARELFLPTGRKTVADRAATLKHDPYEEFAQAAPTLDDPEAPTYLALTSTTFKAAMMEAALDIPGARKAQVGRLVWIEGDYVPVYGIPKLHMAIVRSADQNRTPDVRTRVIVPVWGAVFAVTYVVPMLNEVSVLNLIAAAGVTCGVGDYRQQKGKGHFGSFDVVNADDPVLRSLRETAGRAAQISAMEAAEPYDSEARSMLDWFDVETKRRGLRTA